MNKTSKIVSIINQLKFLIMRKTISYLGMALMLFGTISVTANETSLSKLESPVFEISTLSFDATPLCKAISENDIDLVNKLISYGVDVNGRTRRGVTPLMIAARYNNAEIAKILITKGAKLSLLDELGNSAMDHAKSSNSEEVIEVLKIASKRRR